MAGLAGCPRLGAVRPSRSTQPCCPLLCAPRAHLATPGCRLQNRQALGVRCSSKNSASPSPTSSVDASASPTASVDFAPELRTLINAIPFTKLAIWGFTAALAYQLHDFAGMVLGTFIVAFIGNSFVQNAQEAQLVQSLLPTQPMRRQVLVLLYFFMILGIFTLLGVLTIPDIAREGADFVNRLQSDNIWVILVEKMRRGVGDQVMTSLEKAVYLATSNDIAAAALQEPQDQLLIAGFKARGEDLAGAWHVGGVPHGPSLNLI